MKASFTKIPLRFVSALVLSCFATLAHAAVCQFNQASGSWTVPANWTGCGAGNGVPAGTPGPADRAEITTGNAAVLPAGVFSLGELYLQGGTVQGAGIGATVINTGGTIFTTWGAGSNALNSLSLNLGLGAGIDSTAGVLNINTAELVTNSGTSVIGLVNISGSGAKIKMTGGTAYHAAGDHFMSGSGEFENQSGVFRAVNSITVNGTFLNSGNIEIPAGVTLTLGNAAAMTQLDPVFSLIFGDGILSAPGQVLTLATGGVRGGNLTFNVGTLNNTGAVVRPAPAFGATGVLTINGNFVQSGTGLVDFNLAGTAPSQYDRIVVSGNVTLGGGISRGAVGTFAPPVGTLLDIITAGSVSGGFSSGSEAIVFDAPRRYVEIISATKVTLRANETVWVVGSTDDVSPTQPSLRNALARFNAESSLSCANAPYSIHFLLSMGDTTIAPATPLPAINGCAGLLIDGYQQAGAVPNSSVTDWNANLVVTLDGTNCAGCSGLDFFATNSTVKGINFTNWPNAAINVNGGASSTSIQGNYFFQGAYGVNHLGSQDLRIGQAGNVAARNVFVHAAQAGIYTTMQPGGSPLRIEENLIGAGAGLVAGPNAKGIMVAGTSGAILSGNTIANNTKGLVVQVGTGIDYSGNNTFLANGIAVDLGDDGPTANDDVSPPYDTDMGANQQLNFPKILSVTPTSVSTANVSYELRSNPGSNFQLCFCRNPSGGAQCEVPLTPCQAASTDASGLYTNTIGILGLSAGTALTMFTQATSGPKSGNMSEISPGVTFATASCALNEVTSTADSGACTLRATITALNASCVAPKTITFNISGTGPFTIQPLTPLPDITCAGVTIDGYSQPGASVNTTNISSAGHIASNNANLMIILNGSAGATGRGISILADNVTVKGLSIHSFQFEGIYSTGNNVIISGNYVGTDPGGMTAFPNGFAGIKIAGGSGTQVGLFNVVTGNTFGGIQVFSPATNFNISTNWIGGNRAGGGTIMSGGDGIQLYAANGNSYQIANNLIHFHGGHGIYIDSTAVKIELYANLIHDTGLSGIANLGNGGIQKPVITTVTYGTSSTTIAGTFLSVASGNHFIDVFDNGFPVPSQESGTEFAQRFSINAASAAIVTPFSVTAAGSPQNLSLTLTAANNTSEFSALYRTPFTISPSPAPFNVTAGAAAVFQNFTVLNISGSPLTFGAAPWALPAGGFVVGTQTCASATLMPVGTCNFQTGFSSAVAGTFGGTEDVSVTQNSVTTILQAPLSAVAAAAATPVFSPSATSFTFPSQTVATSSAAQTLTITNSGTAAMSILSPTISAPFAITANSCIGLSPLGTCTISFTFTPTVAGAATGTLSIPTNAPGSPHVIMLSGTGAVAATGPYAYIPIFTSFSGSTVSVIDLPTNTLATTISVGLGPVAATVNTANTRVYVSNQQANSISVIDTATNTVTATIPVGSQPGTAALNPAGTRLYVPNQTSNNLSVIDTSTNTVIATISGLAFPAGAAVNPAGTRLYVNLSSSNSLGVIDTATNTLLADVPVASGPYLPVVNSAGTRVYVVCTSGNVSVLDTSSNTVIATISVGSNSRGIALNPAGTRAYVVNSGSNNISILDLTTNTVLTTVTAGSNPWGVAGNAAGTRMYVANSGSNSVSVFDTATNTVVATVPVGIGPVGLGQFLAPAAVAPAPSITLAPTTLPFGTRTVNTTSPAQGVTLTSSGTASLVISSITSSGDFGFTTTCPLLTPPLAPAGTCTISITFTPLTVAALTGNVTIVSNAPGSPHVISLTGTGSAVAIAGIGLSPASLDFGSQAIGIASALQTVRVTNTGFATLNLLGASASPPFSRQTIGPTQGDCGASLAPSLSCLIAVAFTPTVSGSASGLLSIISNASGSPHQVMLTGIGTTVAAPQIAVPATFDFGDQIINTGATGQLAIDNTGSGPLTISAITLTGTDAASFTAGSDCPTVPAGSSCRLNVTFTAVSAGVKTAQLVIVSDSGGAARNSATTNVVNLRGNGILAPKPVAKLSVTGLGFGNVIFGGATPSQLITLTNTGGVTMSISAIQATGDYLQMNSCTATLAPNASCSINVMFSPLGLGSRFGELQVYTNADGSPHRVQLGGTGCRWFSQSQSRFLLTACGN